GEEVQENAVADSGPQQGPAVNFPIMAGTLGSVLVSGGAAPTDQVQALIARLNEIQQRLDDSEYENSKKLKEQGKLITAQSTEIRTLKGRLDQLEEKNNAPPQHG